MGDVYTEKRRPGWPQRQPGEVFPVINCSAAASAAAGGARDRAAVSGSAGNRWWWFYGQPGVGPSTTGGRSVPRQLHVESLRAAASAGSGAGNNLISERGRGAAGGAASQSGHLGLRRGRTETGKSRAE